MDPRDVYRDDEAWIEKYRAALDSIPVQPSSDMSFHTRLRNTCNIVLLLMRKVLGNFRIWNPSKSAPLFGSRPVQPKPLLPTDFSIGRKSPPENRKPSTRKAGTTARSGLRINRHAHRRTTSLAPTPRS
jgi:hypothetical protein